MTDEQWRRLSDAEKIELLKDEVMGLRAELRRSAGDIQILHERVRRLERKPEGKA